MEFFVHITGSAPLADGPEVVNLAQKSAYETALALLREGIGVVALVGASPNPSTAPFDDEIIRAAADHVRETGEAGTAIRTVRHRTKWMTRIGEPTKTCLDQLDGRMEGETIADDAYTGGTIRDYQARLSDGAIVIGGYRGVKETADIMLAAHPRKPVDEIFVRGLSSGLPEDVRDLIDESRSWNSEADQRTVISELDCAKVAHRIASRMKESLHERANTPQTVVHPRRSRGKLATLGRGIWRNIAESQLSMWISNALRAVSLMKADGGSG